MSTASDTITVDVPLSTAYNQWTQMESYPKFMAGVKSVRQLDDKHLKWTMNVAGVERDFDVEITEQIPDRLIAWQSSGELEQSGRVSFTPHGPDATEITLALDWEPSGVTEQVGSALQVDDALVARDLSMFKDFIESRGQEEGAWRGEVNSDEGTSSVENMSNEGMPWTGDMDTPDPLAGNGPSTRGAIPPRGL